MKKFITAFIFFFNINSAEIQDFLIIRSIDKSLRIPFHREMTILEIKQKIKEITGITIDRQVLLHFHSVMYKLENNKSCKYYNLCKDSFIVLRVNHKMNYIEPKG